MLPAILHFVWVGGNMPDWADRNINEFRRLNPAYEVMIHGEEVLLPELSLIYSKITDLASKSDLLRYSALKRYGGWYFDCDFWPFRPIDDIVRAYGLDGSRVFVSKQQGNRNPEWTHNNSPIASGTDAFALNQIIETIQTAELPFSRVEFGPKIIKQLVKQHRGRFVESEPQWFFPANYHVAVKRYIQLGNGYEQVAYSMDSKTGGQKPFAMHLWAAGRMELTEEADDAVYIGNPGGKKCAGILVNETFKIRHMMGSKHTMDDVVEGFENLGYCVEIRKTGDWPCFSRKPDVVAVWNGLQPAYIDDVLAAETEGIPVLRVENGFFDRKNHCHIDHCGILHWSSWATQLKKPAPPEGKDRFAAVWGKDIQKMSIKKPGYILVIGQVDGDTQMQESRFRGSLEIEMAVERATRYLGETVYFRPHPYDHGYTKREKYLPLCPAATLEEAISEAKFAIMINSNSGVECLALGRPVLCLGPATYEMAGVAKQTTPENLRTSIIEMLQNWMPDQEAVNNYLYWLAARQWSYEEVRNTDLLDRLVEAAQ